MIAPALPMPVPPMKMLLLIVAWRSSATFEPTTMLVPLAPAPLALASLRVTPPVGAVTNIFPVKGVWPFAVVPNSTVLAVALVFVKVRLPAPASWLASSNWNCNPLMSTVPPAAWTLMTLVPQIGLNVALEAFFKVPPLR